MVTFDCHLFNDPCSDTCCAGGFYPRAPLMIHIDGAMCPFGRGGRLSEKKEKRNIFFVTLHLTPREITADQALRGPLS